MTAELLRDLTNYAAPLLGLVIVHSHLQPQLQRRDYRAEILLGALFGLTAVIGMAFPFTLQSGLIFDGRSVVLSLAGFFCGPWAAGFAAALAAAYRIGIGGPGLWMGLGVIATSAALGAAGYWQVRAGRVQPKAMTFLSLGLLVHLCSLVWMLALPESVRWTVISGIAIPFLGVLSLSTWMFGHAFQLSVHRERAQRLANEAESRFRNLVEGSLYGVYLVQDNRLLYANPALEATFGYRPGTLAGRAVEDLVSPPDWPRVFELMNGDRGTAGAPIHHLFQARHADGHLFQAEAYASHVLHSGRPALVGMLVDVTVRERAARQLAQSERLLREAQQAGRIGSYELHVPDMRWTASETLDELFGVGADYPHTVDGWLDLVAPEARDEMARYMQTVLAGAQQFDYEYPIARHRDGARRWLHGFGTVERDARGMPLRMYGVIQDVTERKEAQITARSSERRFGALIDALPDLLWLKDPDGVYLACNPQFERFFGARQADIVGKTDFDFVGRDQAEFFRRKDREAIAAGKPTSNEERITFAADGHTAWVETIKTPLLDEAGRAFGVLGVARDITQRRQLETDLARELRTTRMMLDTMTDGFLRMDVGGKILDTNPAYCAMLGFAREELIGHTLQDLKEPGSESEVQGRIAQIVACGRLRFMTRHRAKNGRYVEIEASVASLPDADPPQVAGFYRDVTTERRVAAQYRELVNRIPAGVFRYRMSGRHGRFEYVSPRFCALIELDEATALAQPEAVLARLRPRDAVKMARLRSAARLAGEPLVWEGPIRLDGTPRWLRVEARAVADTDETFVWHGIATDISERQRMLERLRLDSTVIESTSESIMITDMDAHIVSVNPAFTEVTGYAAGEVVGRTPRLLRSGRHDASFYQGMFRALREVGHWQGQIWNRRKSGESYLELLNISIVRDEEGRPTHYVGVATDITQLKRSEESLAHLAHHDALTGLPNRLLLNLRLEHALEQARRDGHPLAVFFVDLDRFKTVNDSLGHQIGDQLLIAVAARLKSLLHQEDTIGRLGGDEFLIVLEQVADSVAAAKTALNVISAFGQPFVLDGGRELYIEASIGISLHPADGESADLLIRNADTAMFRAKEQGRNTYQFYTEALTAAASSRLDLELRMRRALKQGEFLVWYQPIYRFATQRIVGAEALIRWRTEDGTMVSPDHFIPVAEDSGLIQDIGRHVLRTACADLRAWTDVGLRIETLAVNLSAQQFRGDHFEQAVAHDIAAARVPAQILELELTERGLMDLGPETLRKLHALKELGVSLAIDDFGTGYSSLSYLKRMPVDKLKIDRGFVDHLPEDRSDVAIVNTIVAIARTLGLRVLAEGVETRAQLDFLRESGCNECQGFLFGPAVPADQFANRLRAQPQA